MLTGTETDLSLEYMFDSGMVGSGKFLKWTTLASRQAQSHRCLTLQNKRLSRGLRRRCRCQSGRAARVHRERRVEVFRHNTQRAAAEPGLTSIPATLSIRETPRKLGGRLDDARDKGLARGAPSTAP